MTKNEDSLEKLGLDNYNTVQVTLDCSLIGGMQNDNKDELDVVGLLQKKFQVELG